MSAKILIIDDDDSIRNCLLELLETEAYTVCGGENGRIGLRLVNDFKPDLILCDIMMPELDGYAVREQLLADPATAAIPFIFLTARADRAAQRRGLALGAAAYLTKPFSLQELLQAVEGPLAKRRTPVKRAEVPRTLLAMPPHRGQRNSMKLRTLCLGLIISVWLAACSSNTITPMMVQAAATPTTRSTIAATSAPSTGLKSVAGRYLFTEGPTTDATGNVYFSDINAGKIYKWSSDGSVSVFLDGLNKPNGLAFDHSGNLIACEGGAGRLIAIDSHGQITVLADQYNGTRFNEPNDLWIDPQGGIYFTDPVYQLSKVQAGEDVYYLSSDRSQVTRVIDDLVRPNGLVGTADGKTLYVADHGAGNTYAYTITADGTLTNKRLFASTGSDGVELDADGQLYLTTPNKIQVFDADGQHVQDISIPQENPTNVAFVGETLFITARTAVYTYQP